VTFDDLHALLLASTRLAHTSTDYAAVPCVNQTTPSIAMTTVFSEKRDQDKTA